MSAGTQVPPEGRVPPPIEQTPPGQTPPGQTPLLPAQQPYPIPQGPPPAMWSPPPQQPYPIPQGPPPAMWSPPPPPQPPKRRWGWLIALVALLIVAVVGGAIVAVIALSSGQNATAPTSKTATPTPLVLFQDPLTSNANGWYTGSVDGGYCTFAADGYHITGNSICDAPAATLTDFSATIQVTQIKGPLGYARGLVFRSPVGANLDGYSFDIDGLGHWVFFKIVKGEHTKLHDFTSNAAIARGLNVTNTLQVVAKGSHFTFYVNGVQVGSSDDTTFTHGTVGLTSVDGVEVVYRNLTISAVR